MTAKYSMVWASLALGLGILAENACALSLTPLIMAGIAALVVCGIGFYRWRKLAVLGAALFLLCLGMTRMEIAELEWQSQSSYLIGAEGTFTGIVTEEPSVYKGDNGYTRCIIDLEHMDLSGGEGKTLKGKAYVYTTAKSAYQTGDRVQFTGQLRSPSLFKNPGKLNLAGRYKSMSLVGKIYAEDSLRFVEHTNRFAPKQWAERIRNHLTSYFERHMNNDTAHLLSTLLFGGNYDDIPPDVLSSFSATGIIHILSVSGSHISLLFGFCFLLGSWLRVPKKAALVISFLAVLFYAFMSGFVPPVIRAAAMGLISGGGLFFKRDKTALNVLGTAISGMLLWDPFYLYDVSFQLSAGASAGILLFYQFLCRELSFFAWIPKWIREGTALSCAAQWLILPIILYDFHFFPLYFIPANLCIVPLLEWSIIGGLTASLLSVVSLPLIDFITVCTAFLIELAVKCNLFLSSLPKAQLGIGGMTVMQILLYFYGTAFWYFYKTQGFISSRLSQEKGWAIGVLLACGAVLECCLQPACQVLIPDLGNDRGALILDRNTRIVYYRHNAFSSPLSPVELDSFLQYKGVFKADLLLLDLEDMKEQYLLPLKTSFHTVCINQNQESKYRLNESQPAFVIKKNRPAMYNHDIIITSNGSSWLVNSLGKEIYFNGFRSMEKLAPGHLLWIGGSGNYRSSIKEEALLRMNPEAAVYISRKGTNAAEDQELFDLHRIPLKNPVKDGMAAAAWKDKKWQFANPLL